MANLAVAVSRAAILRVEGLFQRHSSRRVTALSGSPAGGRWGPPGAFPVLYLARPTSSVVIEAYRHLADDVEGMTRDRVAPRTLWTRQVAVSNCLIFESRRAGTPSGCRWKTSQKGRASGLRRRVTTTRSEFLTI